MASPLGAAPDSGDTCAETRDEAQRAWGHVAPNISNPDPCILKCRELFFQRMIPEYVDANLTQVCEALSTGPTGQQSPLRELYCCDSLLCGVNIVDFTGQDPNVNSIINECQRSELGSRAIQDPGHPILGSLCPLKAIARDKDGLPCESNSFIAQEIVPDPAVNPSTLTVLTVDTNLQPQPTQPAVPSTSTSKSPAPSASPTTSSSAHPTQSSQAVVSMANNPAGPTPGAKAAVAVCSSLALLLILAVIFCCLRRHAKAKRYRSPPSTRGRIEHPIFLPGSSPTPLMSPSALASDHQHVPLSPPPRLRERRLLYSVGGSASDKTISVPDTPTAPPRAYSGFPQVPPSPTTMAGKAAQPRTEKSIDDRELGLMMQPVGLDRASGRTASLSSLGSRRTTTASGCSTAAFSLRPPSPQALSPASSGVGPSPLRPPRPHDTPLEIPDLVRPDWAGTHAQIPSPPPNRALPPAPVGSPSYPSSSFQSAMRHRQHDDIGVAIGSDSRSLAPGDPSRDQGQGTSQRRAADHDSWGSWGGGGPGVTFPSPTKRETGNGRADSFVMDEADLERLAGRY